LGLVTLLDQIIDAATDPAASVPDLLRKVQVVARRVGAPDVEAWVRHELQGYPEDVDVPGYRVVDALPFGRFTGPMNTSQVEPLTVIVPGLEHHWQSKMRHPAQVLVSLAEEEGEPVGYPWSPFDVQKYEQSRAFGISMMGLFSVQSRLSRDTVRGVVDNVKSKALDLALDLQTDYPDAGEPGGPTVDEKPQMGQVIYQFTTTNNITGHGTNIAVGHGIEQRSKVQVGDEAALRRGAEELGLAAQSVDHFVSLIQEERDPDGTGLRSFLTRVRMGVIGVGEAVTADVAAAALIELAKGYLGL
jgi:hypothetical protein